MAKDLKQMLKEIIPCIDGQFVLHDGGALGLIRDHNLIDYDYDMPMILSYPITH